jgi:hypothetical protein
MGAAARTHARASFDPALNAKAVAEVYDGLLGITPPPEREFSDEPLATAV